MQGSSHVVGIRIICDEQARVSCRKKPAFLKYTLHSYELSYFCGMESKFWCSLVLLKFLVKYGDFKHCTTMDVVFPHLAMRLGCHLAAHGQVRFFLPVKTTKKTQSSIWAFQDWIEDLKREETQEIWSWPSFQFIGMLVVLYFFNFQHFGFSRRLKDFLSTSVDMRTTSEGLYHKYKHMF